MWCLSGRQDKTMGLTWSEILPAVAKQHPLPASPSVSLVSGKNAQGARLARRKLINFRQDLPPRVCVHPLQPPSHTGAHAHTMKRFLWMRAWEGVGACALQCWYMHWAPELKIKITLNGASLQSYKTQFKVTRRVFSRHSKFSLGTGEWLPGCSPLC